MSEPGYIFIYADDDEDDREFLTYAASNIGVEIATFPDGTELLDFLAIKNWNYTKVFFIDINMPKMSGFECLKRIREIAEYKTTPIFIFSTSNDFQDIDQAKIAGANGFIVKPNNLKKLEDILRKIITINWESNIEFSIIGK